MIHTAVRAVLFDFGGVITDSPFEAFRRFERSRGLPEGFLQSVNRNNPEDNAWARFERGELGLADFDRAFAEEARRAGYEVRGAEVVGLIYGPVRPAMLRAVARCRERFLTACLTNNFRLGGARGSLGECGPPAEWKTALSLFHEVIESSQIGARKPERRFYEIACARLVIEPGSAVFLDDIGANLKPAREMGMRTLKVVDPEAAIVELQSLLGIALD
ncbi:MAG TPA: HAD-IA family hydrolase [Burkholderiales bacterium]|jgi:putative hydrolase of the HAD superfamily|nr:HAD-IA family hydrolase [Burkholderiales bacterium]